MIEFHLINSSSTWIRNPNICNNMKLKSRYFLFQQKYSSWITQIIFARHSCPTAFLSILSSPLLARASFHMLVVQTTKFDKIVCWQLLRSKMLSGNITIEAACCTWLSGNIVDVGEIYRERYLLSHIYIVKFCPEVLRSQNMVEHVGRSN